MTEPLLLLVASDLRQFVYCPRVVYYRYCVPVHPPPTYKMIEGKLQHARVEDLEQRRTLRAYGLADGERVFGLQLTSDRLGISGRLDMVIVRRHEVIPVEFKHTDPRFVTTRPARRRRPEEDGAEGEEPVAATSLSVSLHHKYQLAAYAMLAEERWHRPASRCFVYFVEARAAAPVEIGDGVRQYVMRLLRDMRSMIARQRVPGPTPHAERCRECEYLRFCNDVW